MWGFICFQRCIKGKSRLQPNLSMGGHKCIDKLISWFGLLLIHFQNSRSFHQFQKFHFTKTASESWYKVYFVQIQIFKRTLMCICVLQSFSRGFKRKSSGSNRPRLLQCGHGILREGWEILLFAFLVAETWHLCLEGERVAHGFRSLWGGDESLDVSGCGYVAILQAMQKQRLQRDVVTFGNAMCVWDLNWFENRTFLQKQHRVTFNEHHSFMRTDFQALESSRHLIFAYKLTSS